MSTCRYLGGQAGDEKRLSWAAWRLKAGRIGRRKRGGTRAAEEDIMGGRCCTHSRRKRHLGGISGALVDFGATCWRLRLSVNCCE